MNRDYIDWLETLPCKRKTQKVNVWMGSCAPLDTEIDPAYEAWQESRDSAELQWICDSPVALNQTLIKKEAGPSAVPLKKVLDAQRHHCLTFHHRHVRALLGLWKGYGLLNKRGRLGIAAQ